LPVPAAQPAVAGLGALVIQHLGRLHAMAVREVFTKPAMLPVEVMTYVASHRAALASWASALRHGVQPSTAPAVWSTDPAGFAAERWLSWLHVRNQFLVLAPAAVSSAAELHRTAVEAMIELLASERNDAAVRRSLEAAWGGYHADLARWVACHLGADPIEAVCAEYSAETQLHVLEIDPAQLREPILDIGCGTSGRLVAALRGLGLRASGIDRYAAAPDCLACDWNDYRFAPSTWGTVISHLAMSLHFIHRHVAADDGPAQRHAEKYVEVLRSLVPGGHFIYAPSLPFIEDLLPRQLYQVRRIGVNAPMQTSRGQLELASTTWVTRLA
jgi:hypothetical protein